MGVVTTSTTFKELNYKELQNLAYNFLDKYTDGQLPINLHSIINQIDNLHLMKYSTFAKKHNITLKETTELLKSDDGALWYYPDVETYILLYNDKVPYKDRIRFTIAHELGHYVLRHNEMTEKTIISRYSLKKSEYNTFEREANFFAKHLLVPFPVLGNYSQFFHKMDTDFIQEIFSVSYTVAQYVIKNLNTMYSYGVSKVGHSVEKKFFTYIFLDQTSRICSSCNCKISRFTNFCHICGTEQYEGTTSIEAYLYNKNKERTSRVKYFKYELNDQGVPNKCPQCDNEEINTSGYCNICGTYLINTCIGYYENNFDNWGHHIHISEFLGSGCNRILSGDSRYCPDCGGKSSYYFQGLLKNWDIEKKEWEDMLF